MLGCKGWISALPLDLPLCLITRPPPKLFVFHSTIKIHFLKQLKSETDISLEKGKTCAKTKRCYGNLGKPICCMNKYVTTSRTDLLLRPLLLTGKYSDTSVCRECFTSFFLLKNLKAKKIKDIKIFGWKPTCEFFNPLTPKRVQHLISPYNITLESNMKVMRIKEMITNKRSSWLLNKFSLLEP